MEDWECWNIFGEKRSYVWVEIRMRNRYGLAGGIGIGGKEMKWNDGKYGSDGGFRKRWEAAEKGECERKRILLGQELNRVGNMNEVRMDRWIG